jgi:hypothetical protein
VWLNNLRKLLSGSQHRQPGRPRRRATTRRLTVELLESRDLLSGLTLTPLVQVSSNTSPFAGTTADLSQLAPVAFNREAENMSAVNPTNPKNIVVVWRQDQGNFNAGASSLGIAGAATFDSGVTWKEFVIPGVSLVSGGHFQCATDPWVSFGPTGICYVSSLPFDLSGPGFAGDIDVNISRDGGLTWSAPITVRHDTDPNFFNDKDAIAADPFNPNLVYAVWDRGNFADGSGHRHSSAFNGYKQPGLFARSIDGGQTWQPTQTIYDAGANSSTFDHQLVVRPDGTLFDFFDENVTNNSLGGPQANYLSFLESPDHGQTWLPGGHANRAAAMLPVVTTDPNTGQPLVGNGSPNVFDAVVDPHNGNLYAVWQDARFSGGQYNSIAFTMSTDGGTTWSVPVKINKTPTTVPGIDQQAWRPAIAVAADGSVAVTYYDFRNNVPGGPTLTDYWLVHADAGTDLTNPANWNELRLTDTSFDLQKAALASAGNAEFLGDYESLVAAGNSFGAFFSMTTAAGGTHLFFRDPPPADNGALAGSDAPSLVPSAALGAVGPRNEAVDNTIWLGANAVVLGGFVDTAVAGDTSFTTPANQGKQADVDPLTVVQKYEAGGVTQDPLSLRMSVTPTGADDLLPAVNQVVADDVAGG